MPSTPAILLHGGAWAMDDAIAKDSVTGLKRAMRIGINMFALAAKKGQEIDAVDVAVALMKDLEDDPVFDAGKGSFLTANGQVELDALIGTDRLDIGSVAGLKNTRHPIEVARAVMDKLGRKGCVMIAGEGAEAFARECGIPACETEELLVDRELERLRLFREQHGNGHVDVDVKDSFKPSPAMSNQKPNSMTTESGPIIASTSPEFYQKPHPPYPETPSDTVGCVVRDGTGKVVVALTTGGTPMKRSGRIGDTPLWGSGGYAHGGMGAASTGFGEDLIRVVMAKSTVDRLRYSNGGSAASLARGSRTLDAMAAAQEQVKELYDACGGLGGVIVLGSEERGEGWGVAFNTPRMVFGYWDAKRIGAEENGVFGVEPEDLERLRSRADSTTTTTTR
ncbi:hypothetical protein HDU97_000264 [Phlyctochytrium planicorne]|nr:hypothetical protein HDU97_000264 [Phlyctochytrium planicorne]